MPPFSPRPPPTLPSTVYNTYRSYKQHCHHIVRWVVTTASDLRLARGPSADQGLPPSKRGSGKKGKPSRGRGRKNDDTVNADNPEVSMSKFRQLAAEISSSPNRPQTPHDILARIATVIEKRKMMAAFYSSDADAKQKNTSHLHVIKLYTEVFELLGGKEWMGEDDANRETEKFLQGVERDIETMAMSMAMEKMDLEKREEDGDVKYDSLHPAENEWLKDIPGIAAQPKSTTKKKTRKFPLEKYKVKLEEGDPGESGRPGVDRQTAEKEEATFAVTCYLCDVARLRIFCSELWNQVEPEGPYSRLTASFVTNQAVGIVRQMEYDLKTNFPQFSDLEYLYNFTLGQIPPVILNNTELLAQIKNTFLIEPVELLASFADVMQEGHAPVLKDGFFGYFDPSDDRSQMDLEERQRETRCILLGYLPDLVAVHRYTPEDLLLPEVPHDKCRIIGDTGFVRESRQYIKQRNHPRTMTLNFSTQMFLESVYARRRLLDKDLQAMKMLSRTLRQEIDLTIKLGMQWYDEPAELQGYLMTHSRLMLTQLETDMLLQWKLKYGWDKLSKDAVKKDSLWKMNPWLVANAHAWATVNYFHLGVDVAGTTGFVQSAMHLWNVIKQTGHLKSQVYTKEGNLFEHLILVFGDRVFVGAPPKQKFLNRFSLMLGQRAEAFASGKRQNKGGHYQGPRNPGGRGITPDISDMYNLHAVDYLIDEKMRESILHKAYSKDENGKALAHQFAGLYDPQNPLSLSIDLVENELGRREGSHALINLNLLKIHRQCIRLFQVLDRALAPLLCSISGSTHEELIEAPHQLPYITGWVLRLEVEARERLRNGFENAPLLTAAAAVMEKEVGSCQTADFLVPGC